MKLLEIKSLAILILLLGLIMIQPGSNNKANGNKKLSNTQNNKSSAKINDENEIINKVIETQLPGFKLAQQNDYHSVLSENDRGKSLYQADFNSDGKQDFAVLVINKEVKEYRIYYLLKNGENYKFVLLYKQKPNKANKEHKIINPMFFKPIGEAGLGDNDYNTLTNDGDLPDTISSEEREKRHNKKVAPYKSVPAIEVWTGINENESEIYIDTISYCSQTWYFEKGKLKDFSACD
jgi:hypothetical protein